MIKRILATINDLTAAINRQTEFIERQIQHYDKQSVTQNEANSTANILSRRHLECSEMRLQMEIARFRELDKKEGTK